MTSCAQLCFDASRRRCSVRIDRHLRAVHRGVARGRRCHRRKRRDVLGARKAPRLAQAHLARLDLARRRNLPPSTSARTESPRRLRLIRSDQLSSTLPSHIRAHCALCCAASPTNLHALRPHRSLQRARRLKSPQLVSFSGTDRLEARQKNRRLTSHTFTHDTTHTL